MPDPKPNIVLIMVDDADAKVLEHEVCAPIRALTKTVGADATRYLTSHPICAPSRASMLRGRYPHNTGVNGNTDAYSNFVCNGGETDNIAVWLHDAGYSTAMIGKYLNGYQIPDTDPMAPLPKPPGWDWWFAIGHAAYNGFEYPANNNGAWQYFEDDEGDYLTDVLAAEALEFLDSNLAEDPFFLLVTPMAPHAPAVPAPRHIPPLYDGEMYPTATSVPPNPSFNEDDVDDKPLYIKNLNKFGPTRVEQIHERYQARLRCMASVSDMVVAIVDKLDELDPGLENTYVFFTSDHGFHMGEHRLGRDEFQDDVTPPVPGGKNSMYEEDIRVPLWVRGPGIDADSTVTELLGNVDLAPTFLDIAGITPDPDVDGRSFKPLLEGSLISWRNKYLITRGQTKPYRGIRMADETVFAELLTPAPLEVQGEYYDLVADPYQLENGYLGLESTPLLATLRAKVGAYATCAGSTCRTADSS